MKKIIVYSHPDCLLKDNGPNHPERKERLQVIIKSIKDIKSIDIDFKKAPIADLEKIVVFPGLPFPCVVSEGRCFSQPAVFRLVSAAYMR